MSSLPDASTPGQRAPRGPEASGPLSHAGLGVSPQTAPEDQDEDKEDDFVEVPEKEGYEACVPAHLWPKNGEKGVAALGEFCSGHRLTAVASHPGSAAGGAEELAVQGGLRFAVAPPSLELTLLLCPGHSLARALPEVHPAVDSCCPPAEQALLPAPVCSQAVHTAGLRGAPNSTHRPVVTSHPGEGQPCRG